MIKELEAACGKINKTIRKMSSRWKGHENDVYKIAAKGDLIVACKLIKDVIRFIDRLNFERRFSGNKTDH